MFELSEIWIYPIKSLGGISLQTSKTTNRGLEYDRRWLLVDEAGMFITQRKHPQLAAFKTKIATNFLEVTHKNNTIHIPLHQEVKNNEVKVIVWEDTIAATEVDDLISDWFTNELGFKVKLVYMPETSLRKVDANYAVSSNDITSFSDGYPYLIIGQSSLDDLNSRLKTPVSMNRFRPNFVFIGGTSYEEEMWSSFSIGSINFHTVKPCSRCIMTTIDQEKGQLDGKEPLLTLSKYRKRNNKIYFGENLLCHEIGRISIGDTIKVFSNK